MDHIEAIERIRAMVAPRQQTWDLSPNDVEALNIALALIYTIPRTKDGKFAPPGSVVWVRWNGKVKRGMVQCVVPCHGMYVEPSIGVSSEDLA